MLPRAPVPGAGAGASAAGPLSLPALALALVVVAALVVVVVVVLVVTRRPRRRYSSWYSYSSSSSSSSLEVSFALALVRFALALVRFALALARFGLVPVLSPAPPPKRTPPPRVSGEGGCWAAVGLPALIAAAAAWRCFLSLCMTARSSPLYLRCRGCSTPTPRNHWGRHRRHRDRHCRRSRARSAIFPTSPPPACRSAGHCLLQFSHPLLAVLDPC